MRPADLKQRIISCEIVASLVKNFEVGDACKVRMSLICLDILGTCGECLHLRSSLSVLREGNSLELTPVVSSNMARLTDKKEKVQKKGVKVLTALAQTGERVIRSAV